MAKHKNDGNCARCRAFLLDCTTALKEWFAAEQATDPSIHISQSYRDKDQQEAAFIRGATKARFGQSPHNFKPTPAIDVFYLIDGRANFELARYKELAKRLPPHIESGLNFPIVDAVHIQEREWKKTVGLLQGS